MRPTIMHVCARCLVGGALALVTAGAFAGEITLFEKPGFQGRYLDTQEAVPNLPRAGFDDYRVSAMVATGDWEACSDTNYRGRCVRLDPGRYYNLSEMLDQRISSVREIGAAAAARAASVVPGPGIVTPPADTRIVLISHMPGGDHLMELSSTMRDLERADFADHTDAAIVYGGVWRLCDAPRGSGECTEIGPGHYDSLGALGRRVESVQLIAPATTAGAIAPTQPRIVLYDDRDFGGHSLMIEGNGARNLERMDFDNRAESMRVEAGRWKVCTDEDFEGDCRTFGPGEYPRLGDEFDGEISSARPVAQAQLGALTSR
jgi:hypothetical protein